jgi:hypothetical protein
MVSRRWVTVPLIAAAAAAGCERPLSEPDDVQRATISNQIQGHRSFDEKMAELNLDIPGFAGLWYDSAGRLTIGLVDLSQKEKARSVVATFMGNRAMARIRPVDPAQFAFVKMTFSFSELKATFDRVSDEILERHDVHGIGIDERNNAITALVASAQVTSQVAEALRAAGVPDAQASVLVRPPTVINQTLADDDNPLRGAFNIGSQNSGHGSCTSAFNVRFSGNNNTYIATASHCSKTQGGLDTGAYAWYNTNGWVGYEAYDVGWITCGSYKCQDADVALVDYSLGGRTPAFGKIANTTGWGSTTVSQTDTLSIIGIELYPILNETVQRLGLVTGKTVGDIYDTCVDVKGTTGTPPVETGYKIRCSTQANYGGSPGDSGGPVFSGGLGVVLYGVNWGSHTFSGMLQIENYYTYYGAMSYY